jgi:SSS family solute:Na+ symporter
VLGHITYIAIVALLLNVAVSALFTVIFRWAGVQDGYDETKPGDYTADPVSVPAPAAGTRRQDPLATR